MKHETGYTYNVIKSETKDGIIAVIFSVIVLGLVVAAIIADTLV